MNIQNPYVLLRVLIVVDVLATLGGVILPTFAHISLLDYLDELRNEQLVYALYGYAWLASLVILIAGWIGLLLVKPWGRVLYALSLVPFFGLTYVGGQAGFGPGLQAVMAEGSTLIFGFILAMLYCGPVACLFQSRRTAAAVAVPQNQ